MRRLWFVLASLLSCVDLQMSAQEPISIHRVLVPILVRQATGAYGSVWTTELWVHNAAHIPMGLAPIPVADSAVGPDSSYEVEFGVAPGAASGLFYYVVGVPKELVTFNVRLRNETSPCGSPGTELPAVWEDDFRSRLILLSTTMESGSRVNVRVYAAGVRESATALMRIYDLSSGGGALLSQETVTLISDRLPHEYYPAYATIPDLVAHRPELAMKRIRIEVSSVDDVKLWAFATVTDNVTQNVQTITP